MDLSDSPPKDTECNNSHLKELWGFSDYRFVWHSCALYKTLQLFFFPPSAKIGLNSFLVGLHNPQLSLWLPSLFLAVSFPTAITPCHILTDAR